MLLLQAVPVTEKETKPNSHTTSAYTRLPSWKIPETRCPYNSLANHALNISLTHCITFPTTSGIRFSFWRWFHKETKGCVDTPFFLWGLHYRFQSHVILFVKLGKGTNSNPYAQFVLQQYTVKCLQYRRQLYKSRHTHATSYIITFMTCYTGVAAGTAWNISALRE
jgi:hypothetical protein